jgi:tetrapyrrole methylase family protein/MazG family protein
MSFIEPVLTALGVDAMAGLQIHDALEVAVAHYPPLTPDVAALVGQLYSRALAADVKLTLMNQYPDEHEVVLISSAGEKTQRVTTIPLYELDRQADVDHLTSLYIPPLIEATGLCALQETVAHLRAPDGCPWDREQTHQSLRSDLLEETYETLEAIESGSQESLCEELGDLLLQIVLHAQIATEEGEFQMWQVISGLVAKLKHRHPHVWGEQMVSGTDEVLQRWDELKREERDPERRSVLDGVPRTLPALQQADTVGRRVARVGFDWSDVAGVTDKIYEEMDELVSADTPETQEAELGDLLFAVVNWARWLDIDPEAALRGATGRFVSRFRQVERIADEQSLALASMSIDELETLWQRAKGAS